MDPYHTVSEHIPPNALSPCFCLRYKETKEAGWSLWGTVTVGRKAEAEQHMCIYGNYHQGTVGTTAQLIYMREDEREKGEGEGEGKGER